MVTSRGLRGLGAIGLALAGALAHTVVDAQIPYQIQPPDTVYVSANASTMFGALEAHDEDIVAWDAASESWTMYFDGSDVGLRSEDVDAFHIVDDDNPSTLDPILLSLDRPNKALGFRADDSDVVLFVPSAIGDTTSGRSWLLVDGSRFGLTLASEDVDAITISPEGRLLLSTVGAFEVRGDDSSRLTGGGEDLIRLEADRRFSMYFDGSDVQLVDDREDISAAWIHPDSGYLYASSNGPLSLIGANAAPNDVWTFFAETYGPATIGPIDEFWRGGEHGFAAGNIDGLQVALADLVDPIAVDDVGTVEEDSPDLVVDVRANDVPGNGGSEGIWLVTQPANGTVEVFGSGTGLTYEPDPDYCNDGNPTDDFTYSLTPGGSTATVSMTVTCVDDPPIAVDDEATVAANTPDLVVDVRANDIDVDGGPGGIVWVTQPANGTVEMFGSGTGLTYEPDPDYCNDGNPTDDFTYTLSGALSTATVSMTVTCPD